MADGELSVPAKVKEDSVEGEEEGMTDGVIENSVGGEDGGGGGKSRIREGFWEKYLSSTA